MGRMQPLGCAGGAEGSETCRYRRKAPWIIRRMTTLDFKNGWPGLRALGFSLLRQVFRLFSGPSPFFGLDPPGHIILLRTHSIGDVLLTTPVLRALKQAWPRTRLTMLVGNKSRPILEGNPHLDALFSFPESWWFQRHWRNIAQLIYFWRRVPKDVLLLFHASSLVHLWGWLLGAPVLVGFDDKGSGFSLSHRVPLDFREQRYLGEVNLDLVRALGVPAVGSAPEIFLSSAELATGAGLLQAATGQRWLVGVAPGGGQNPLEQISVKQWPASHYAQLLQELATTFPVTILLLGDQHDTQIDWLARTLQSQGGEVLNLKGRTSLRELAAVIGHLDLLICNDSAPMHLAVALKTPVVALFGPTAATALFPAGSYRVALQSPALCSPCYPFGRFPGCPDPVCMAALSVATVYQAVTELLAQLGSPKQFRAEEVPPTGDP
jgi:ADP-heptose:LPS heptosyltransferase